MRRTDSLLLPLNSSLVARCRVCCIETMRAGTMRAGGPMTPTDQHVECTSKADHLSAHTTLRSDDAVHALSTEEE